MSLEFYYIKVSNESKVKRSKTRQAEKIKQLRITERIKKKEKRKKERKKESKYFKPGGNL
jgi:hypothetical protein